MRAKTSPVGGKICPSRQLLPAASGASEQGQPLFHWVFHHGTALAEKFSRSHALAGVTLMLLALGAASSAIDALVGLASSKQAQPAGSNGQAQPNLFAFRADAPTSTASTAGSASGGGSQISAETMSALLAAQGQGAQEAPTSRANALKHLFGQIDADGDGKITKSEFEDALGAGGTNLAKADDVFSKLDANSDDSVSLDEMSKALKGGHHGHHHAQGAGDASGSGSGSSSRSSGGSTSTSTTGADGSTTTTVTYAVGFKMSTTVPGASSSRNSAYDLFAQLMQRQGGQGQGASATVGSSMSMSV